MPEARKNNQTIDWEPVFALIVLENIYKDRASDNTIEKISGILVSLCDKGKRFHNLGLSKVPGGFYSEYIEAYVQNLIGDGYASGRTPIVLTREGEKLLKFLVNYSSSEYSRIKREFEEIAEMLGISIKQIIEHFS